MSLSVYLVVSLTEYLQYESNGFDLGIFDQAVRQYAHFHLPTSSVKAPGFDLLGDHFSPVVGLFTPLYWIWDDPMMLLIAQAVLISASVPILHRIAARRLPDRPALIATCAYAFGWPILAMVNFDVHELAFGVPLLAAALDATEQRQYRRAVWWACLLLLVKEDMGVVLVAFSFVFWIFGRAEDAGQRLRDRLRRPPRAAWVVLAIGVLGYVITTKAIIPEFAPRGGYAYWQYDAIGTDIPDSIKNLLLAPWRGLHVFFSPAQKMFTLAMLLLPLACLPLRSPYIILALPFLAERFFNERAQLWVPIFHYNALPWLVLVVAFIDAAARMRVFETDHNVNRRRLVATWIVVFQTFSLWAWNGFEDRAGRSVITRIEKWNNSDVLARKDAAEMIPPNTCVEADDVVAPYLTPRNWVTLPGAANARPDFVILDNHESMVGPSQTGAPGADGPPTGAVLQRAVAASYVVVRVERSLIILRDPNYSGPRRRCGPTGGGPGGPSPFGTFAEGISPANEPTATFSRLTLVAVPSPGIRMSVRLTERPTAGRVPSRYCRVCDGR
jgi:uncharacterized membrane protein